MDTIASAIKHCFLDYDDIETVVFQPKTSTNFKTYDGVEVIGNRFLKELYLEIVRLRKESDITVTKFSIVGYSLGGLISRYIIGKLYEVEFFDIIEPYVFTTFATPHLGVKFFSGLSSPILNFLGSTFIGRSGSDLFLKTDIMKRLIDKEDIFFRALELFKDRFVLSNIRHDRTVAFYTSFLTDCTPFENWSKTKLGFFEVPNIKVKNELVKPSIVDLKNSKIDLQLRGARLTLQNRLRFIGVVLLIALIIPVWFPIVLTANIFGSVYSFLRLHLTDTSVNNEYEWEFVKRVLLRDENQENNNNNEEEEEEINDIYQEDLKYIKDHSKINTLAKETNEITEGVIEGVLQATTNNYDLENNSDAISSLNSSAYETMGLTSNGTENKDVSSFVEIDIGRNTKEIIKLLPLFDSLQMNENDFPLFQDVKNKLPFDNLRKETIDALRLLKWFKIPVYVDSFNAHEGIVARRGLRSSYKGIATVYFWCILLRAKVEEYQKL